MGGITGRKHENIVVFGVVNLNRQPWSLSPGEGGQFEPVQGGHFKSVGMVNLNWYRVVNLTGVSTLQHYPINLQIYLLKVHMLSLPLSCQLTYIAVLAAAFFLFSGLFTKKMAEKNNNPTKYNIIPTFLSVFVILSIFIKLSFP